jgi:TPR repeat protein
VRDDAARLAVGVRPRTRHVGRRTRQRSVARNLRQLEQLAAGGDAFAGGLSARLYLEGAGVKTDPARALAFVKPAAERGSTEAMRVLGWAYKQGDGVDLDLPQAAAWWRRGAEGGNSLVAVLASSRAA